MKPWVLVVDDEEALRYTLERFLANDGYEVSSAGTYTDAMALISGRTFDVIITDIVLGDRTGIDILEAVNKKNPASPVIMITGYPTIETASEALRLGAFDYTPKPVQKQTLLRAVKAALSHKRLIDETIRYRSNLEAILRSVRDAIITVDRDLRLTEVNEAAESICGISKKDIGKAFSSRTADCNGKCLEAMKVCLETGDFFEVRRHECNHKDRTGLVVDITASPLLDASGQPGGCVLVLKDETRLAELERDLTERRQFHNMVGKSDIMQKIYALIEDLSGTDTTVLITGETGTGKELVAEALHYKSARADKPLVKVDCSALSESLLESELFGHVRGAFTGAIKDKAGRFKTAEGGTLFLDEIGDISPKVQQQLLRFLQEKTYERVGDATPITSDVRIVAATNKDLLKKTRLGEFREDLYYRLKVVEINLPSLREKKEDIPLLVEYLLEKLSRKLGKSVTGLSHDAERLFMEYDWPGNVRELAHALEHACIICRRPVIDIDDLPPELKWEAEAEYTDDPDQIVQILKQTDWNIAKASRVLGMSRPTLYRKIEELGLSKE